MPNTHLNEITIDGDATVVAALKSTILGGDLDWLANANVEWSEPVQFQATFSTSGEAPFAKIETAIAELSGVVILLTSVELGNRFAEARVYDGSREIGRHVLPSAEVALMAGEDEMDEGAVVRVLWESVESYRDDALRDLERRPAPTLS